MKCERKEIYLKEKKPTVNEHFVPKTYLKGFSFDEKMIYEYDCDIYNQIKVAVKIDDVCQDKNLYEYKNAKGEFLDRNYLENILSEFESIFPHFRKDVESRAFIEANYSSSMFFSGKEKRFIKGFIALQIMRSPYVINQMESELQKEYGQVLRENEARTIAIRDALPLYTDMPDGYGILHKKILDTLTEMTIAIGVDKTDSIFTSDFPIYCQAKDNRDFRLCEKIIYPLTSSLIVILRGWALKNPNEKNILFPLDEKHLYVCKSNIASAAKRWILSKKPLTEEEKELIKKART